MPIKELIIYWNNLPEHISPILLSIGHFQLRYYGLMYLVAFTITYLLVLSRIKNENFAFKNEVIDNYFIWAILSVLIGGRLGYALFYNLSYYLKHPLEIILPFDVDNGFQYTGLYGMSYHGALIGGNDQRLKMLAVADPLGMLARQALLDESLDLFRRNHG